MKWLLGVFFLLAIGLVFKLGLLVYAMYVLLGVLVASRYLTWEWIDNLSATRNCPQETAQIGDSVKLSVSIRNHGRLPVPWLIVEESMPMDAIMQHPPRIQVTGKTLLMAQLPARDQKTLNYDVRFLMRGYYQFGPLLLESGDLFGLHRRYRVETQPHFILVYPKVVPLEGYDVASRRPIGEVRMSHRLFEDPTRISGVRPYETGDPLNRIHWRATARTGVLHSKIYEPSCVAGATIVLDFHRESYRISNPHYRAELAITTAASLANAVYQMGEQVGLVTNGRDAADRIHVESRGQGFRTRSAAKTRADHREANDRLQPLVVQTQRGAGQLMRILETLARLEITDGFSFSQLLMETTSRLPRDATVIAVVTDVTPETAIALGSLKRRGYAVTAVLVMFGEVEFFDWAQPPDWACRLLAEGIDFRRVDDEQTLARLCAEQILK